MSAPVTKRVSGNEAWYLIMGKAGVQLFKKCKSSVFYCVKDGDGGDGGDGAWALPLSCCPERFRFGGPWHGT